MKTKNKYSENSYKEYRRPLVWNDDSWNSLSPGNPLDTKVELFRTTWFLKIHLLFPLLCNRIQVMHHSYCKTDYILPKNSCVINPWPIPGKHRTKDHYTLVTPFSVNQKPGLKKARCLSRKTSCCSCFLLDICKCLWGEMMTSWSLKLQKMSGKTSTSSINLQYRQLVSPSVNESLKANIYSVTKLTKTGMWWQIWACMSLDLYRIFHCWCSSRPTTNWIWWNHWLAIIEMLLNTNYNSTIVDRALYHITCIMPMHWVCRSSRRWQVDPFVNWISSTGTGRPRWDLNQA